MTWRFTERLISHGLAELSERVEAMDDATFLAAHRQIHAEPRSAVIDLVAATFEAEWWKRFPDGRPDDDD